MIIKAIDMKPGQTGKIVKWGDVTHKVKGLKVTRVDNSLFLDAASWQDVFHDKTFLDENHQIKLDQPAI